MRPRRATPPPRRGFSLIEVLTAVALFSVGIVATITAWNTATRLLEHQRHTGYALHATEAVLEELLLLVTTDPDLPAGTRCFDRDGGGAACGSAAEVYRTTWETVPHPAIARVLVVTARTTWTEGNPPRTKIIELRTQRF